MTSKFSLKTLTKSKLVKDTGIYTVSALLNKAIPFLLLPVLTRYLSPADYGIVSTFNALLGISGVLVLLSSHGAITVEYFKKQKDELAEYIGNSFLIIFCSFVVFSLFAYFGRSWIADNSGLPQNWVPVLVFIGLFQAVAQIQLALWRAEQTPIRFGVFQTALVFINLFLSVVLVVSLYLGWEGRLYALLSASFIGGILALVFLVKDNWIKLSVNINYIKDILKFGVPLVPHAFGGWIITTSDRLFLNNMVGIDSTGLYTVGYQIGMIVGIFAQSFNLAWTPYLFKTLEKAAFTQKQRIVQFTYVYFVGITLFALLLAFAAPLILKYFVAQSFQKASGYVIWIALGYAASGMYYMVANYIFYVKKTYILAYITFGTAICNLGLNYMLISLNGSVGAAQATTISFFLSFLLTWLYAVKVYKMPWGLRRAPIAS